MTTKPNDLNINIGPEESSDQKRAVPVSTLNIPWNTISDFNIKYSAVQILPTPYREMEQEEFLALNFGSIYGLKGTFYHSLWLDGNPDKFFEQFSSYGFTNNFGVTFYWYPFHGLAVAHRHVTRDEYDRTIEYFSGLDNPTNEVIWTHLVANREISVYPGMGSFVATPQAEYNGHLLRYFQIGCDHKSKRHVTHAMFDHSDICNDCGMEHRYDSSG